MMIVRTLAIAAVFLVLWGCESFPRTDAETVMIELCKDVARKKPVVAQEITADATRPAHARRFSYEDLAAVKAANDELTRICPPPEGFSPYALTIRSAQSALAVLATYAGPEEAIRR